MKNINDLAKEWLEGLGMDRYVKEQTSETVSRFASYLSDKYVLTPKEEVKEELLGTDDSDWVRVKLYGFRKNGVTTITREEIIKTKEPVKEFKPQWSQCNDCFDGDHDKCSGGKCACPLVHKELHKPQPSNKSTGVKVECKHEWHALPANKGLNDIYCRHCGQER